MCEHRLFIQDAGSEGPRSLPQVTYWLVADSLGKAFARITHEQFSSTKTLEYLWATSSAQQKIHNTTECLELQQDISSTRKSRRLRNEVLGMIFVVSPIEYIFPHYINIYIHIYPIYWFISLPDPWFHFMNSITVLKEGKMSTLSPNANLMMGLGLPSPPEIASF